MSANMSFVGKALAAWLVMLLVSIANGAARDFTYGRFMSELAAHQLSTLGSILLLGLVIRLFVRRYPLATLRQAIFLGLGWCALTVAFEFLFFHFVGGHPWSELLVNYDISAGRVWVLVLLWIAMAPALFFRSRRPS